jgi:Zn-dependent protease with chaperone function
MAATAMASRPTTHPAPACLLALLLLAGCSAAPRGAYFPPPADPATIRVSGALHRAVVAAGDEPDRYSFAFVASPIAVVASDEEATLYVTEGLARQPLPVVEAAIAHEVAHEVLGHAGTRRALALSMSASFTVLGAILPGAGLVDLVATPVAVRAFTRRQELDADQKAIEILRGMGHAAPRRSLAAALRALAATSVRPKEDAPGPLSPHPSLEQRLEALEPLEPAPALVREPNARP